MTWTDERVDRLKAMHAEGLSCSIIAMRLGGVTRNAIIGKVHRLKLASRGRSQSEQTKHFRKRKRKVRRPLYSAQKVRKTVKANVQFPTEPLPPEDTPRGPLVMFADLEPHHCRAPYGDPKQKGFGFCGCNTIPGLPYCEDHARRFYTASKIPRPNAWNDQPSKPAVLSLANAKKELAL